MDFLNLKKPGAPRWTTFKIKILADKTPDGIERVQKVSEDGLKRGLFDKATGKAAPWPTKGIKIQNEGGAPERVSIPRRFIDRGRTGGWIHTLGDTPVVRAAGPSEEEKYRKTHTFLHIDTVVVQDYEGVEYQYKVVRQPDKYLDGVPGDYPGNPKAEVFHNYLAERVS